MGSDVASRTRQGRAPAPGRRLARTRRLEAARTRDRLDADGKVTHFYEKPKDPPTTLASCGLYWLPAETLVLLDRYLSEGNNPDQPGHYMQWLSETDSLYASTLDGRWLDIGDRASYDKAYDQFRAFQNHPQKEKT